MSGQPFRARFGFDADGQKLIDLADPTAAQDAVNLRTLQQRAGMHIVARVGNLPTPSDPDPTKRPAPGSAYLVKFDLDGIPQDRIAVWDDALAATGGVKEVHIAEPAADTAAIQASAGTSDPGNPFDAGGGKGAVLDLLANADGSMSATVTAPGSGYVVGDQLVLKASSLSWPGMTGDTTITVTKLSGASETGGWRFVDPQIWVKKLRTDPDPAPGARPGDLEITTEKDHEELKVWDGTTFHSIVSVDQIKAWIASLNLFQGTVQEIGGTVVGTIDVAALPNITDPTVGVAHTSQYWVWTGQAGWVVPTPAPAHGSGTHGVPAGTAAIAPNGLSEDLAGAVLQVGDWLQVSSRPGTNPGDPVSYHWSQIGGDLLARSRADVLYGLNGWVAGNYEKGSLVNYLGDLYRADRPVLPADTAPGTKAVAANPGAVPPVVGVTAAPWTKVPLSGGVKSVATDGDLPATAPASAVYLVISSARAGAKAALYSYDTGSTQWVELGGGAASPLTLDKGDMLIGVGCPIGTVAMWVLDALPPGWLKCDGATVDAALYPELAALFPTLPDFRGSFLRGAGLHGNAIWGDAARAVGSWQDDSTAPPNTAFTGTTSSDGIHNHAANPHLSWHGLQNGGGSANLEWDGGPSKVRADDWTTREGNHTHTVTIAGGDSETRPKNWAVHYIMKATDRTVKKHAVTWPTTPVTH